MITKTVACHLELARKSLKISAAASAGCPAALSLGSPIVCIGAYSVEPLQPPTKSQGSLHLRRRAEG